MTPPKVANSAARADFSARLDADRAISEFRRQAPELTRDEAMDAYAHLMIGRGFSRPRKAYLAPAMTVQPVAVASEVPAASIEVAAEPAVREAREIKTTRTSTYPRGFKVPHLIWGRV